MAPRDPELPDRTLTAPQIAMWATQGGFQGEDAVTAVAVALAESGGHTNARHVNADGSTDYGVWQINAKWWPDLFERYPLWWSVDNAVMAKEVRTRGRRGWGEWTTYRTGAYRLYLPSARDAVANPDRGNIVTPAPGDLIERNPLTEPLHNAANAVAGLAQAVSKTASWLADRHNIVRIAQVGVGAALLIGALVIVAGPRMESVAGAAVSVASKRPAGKVAA